MTTHFTPSYFKNNNHNITVNVIGAGGNGSHILTQLVAINETLRGLSQNELDVTCYDNDTVSSSNLGRQKFYEVDINENKAITLINRINRAYNYSWKARPFYYKDQETANITILCVDTLKSRKEIYKYLKGNSIKWKSWNKQNLPFYVLDLGNNQNSGQFILSTANEIKQPNVTIKTQSYLKNTFELFPTLENEKEETNIPSCSTAEAIRKQDLFINPILSMYASKMLWDLLIKGKVNYQGMFINLERSNTKIML